LSLDAEAHDSDPIRDAETDAAALFDLTADEAGVGSSGSPAPTDKTRELLLEVVNAAVFASGLLEKVVDKRIEKRLAKVLRAQLTEVVDKQVRAALSSDDMKILVDDKFRAISLYLKGEVIPKTVAKILKEKEIEMVE
jgi:hypothetical protein